LGKLDKEAISHFLNKKVKIVKSNDFVIWGKILSLHDTGFMFFTDNKTIFLSFEAIKEIVPIKENSYGKYKEYYGGME